MNQYLHLYLSHLARSRNTKATGPIHTEITIKQGQEETFSKILTIQWRKSKSNRDDEWAPKCRNQYVDTFPSQQTNSTWLRQHLGDLLEDWNLLESKVQHTWQMVHGAVQPSQNIRYTGCPKSSAPATELFTRLKFDLVIFNIIWKCSSFGYSTLRILR